MKQTTLVAIILSVLIVLSVAQAFQLYTLKAKVSEGSLTVGTKTGVTPSASGANGNVQKLPSNIQNLPQMVGGC
ncbi:hypothetical protein HYW21_02630 [Candidatus Woesearchaeota archaeon]|nr:hypothetical protein [Candidatus Woesearchaeota archaeon]